MDIKKLKDSGFLIDRVEQALKTVFDLNENFNEALNGDEPLVLCSLKDPGGEYRFEASEILYWVDRNAYIDELEYWDGEKAKEKHQCAIQFLTASDQESTFRDLIESIRRHRVSPFIGAGVSKAANYPMWGEALMRIVGKLEGVDFDSIEQHLEAFDYLGAAQILYDASPEQVNRYIRTEFRLKYDPEDKKPSLPAVVRILPKIAQGCIVTTNFDSLIEESFKLANKPLDGYMHGLQPGHNFVQRLLRGERCILKLHGDAPQENTYVFTKSQYESAYGDPIDFSKQLPKALRQIYISNSLLFLGCSLDQDKTLDLFKAVFNEGHFEIPEHFALLPMPSTVAEKSTKETRLLGMNIQPIWYEQDESHSMVENLLELAIDVSNKHISLG
ncbi:MAG: SIR2 family protein [Desulfuromusa sp.]